MQTMDILMEKGVLISHPKSVEIGPEVRIDRIEPGVRIYPGCRIHGEKTLLLKGACLGEEGPVTLIDCFVGPDVALKGGYVKGTVFLEGASMGSGAHVREGTILEEYASGAHTVGLKQTILFPFVTLGSLINFCDCFMAGGTSRKDHSEVGSAYIHFNYTPNQDKATASLLGDVPRGVMLDQPPIFLGGQGGLVGPCRIGFGSVIAAGSVYRKDEPSGGQLLIAAPSRGGRVPFKRGIYQNLNRIVRNNVLYIANLQALMQWYRKVRGKLISDRFSEALWQGLVFTLELNIGERIKRLADFFENAHSARSASGKRDAESLSDELIGERHRIVEKLEAIPSLATAEAFLEKRFMESLNRSIERIGKDYLSVIQSLEPESRESGTRWLASIVGKGLKEVFASVPSMQHGQTF